MKDHVTHGNSVAHDVNLTFLKNYLAVQRPVCLHQIVTQVCAKYSAADETCEL